MAEAAPLDPTAPLVPYGWSDRWAALFADVARPGDAPGRVVRHDGAALLVATGAGLQHLPVRASSDTPTVGDWVVVQEAGAVAAVLPRASALRRRDAHADVEQLLAANVDLVAIVCGLDRPVRAGRIDRAVALAWDAGATPVLLLTKADLHHDPTGVADELAASNPGLDVLVSAALVGDGLGPVVDLARGRTTVLVGESGAGKSTLANALVGEDVAATAAVRRGDAKGRHTTTSRQLSLLPAGGVLIDTPGIRAVGLWGGTDTVDEAFGDVDDAARGCRFGDCGHDGEPGCAVAAAVAAGELDQRRLEAWRALRREAAALARRSSEHEQRRWGKQFARTTKEAQRRKGRR